jgi:branched-chain amino acid aminotransferase
VLIVTTLDIAKEPICFCMGQLLPLKQLCIPASDIGFIHGVTVSEQVRTFCGNPFLLDKHFDRWCRGLKALQLAAPCDLVSLQTIIQQLLEHNARLLPANSEQGICFFSSPGQADLGWMPATTNEPTFSAYSYPLPIGKHRQLYRSGVRMVTTSIRDVPVDCWPNSVKIRSRLHYYLAQQQARAVSPEAHPILLDLQSTVSDSSIASIVGWTQHDGLIVRPAEQRYSSITVGFLIELAQQLGIPITERTFSVAQLQNFTEAFLVSTPWCFYPIQQVDDVQLAGHSQGFPMFTKISKAWESNVNGSIFS